MTRARLLASLVLVAGVVTGPAGAHTENVFGAIHIDGKKAGQVHYTIEYGDGGDVETLRTRASLSILGVKLFNFEQTLHETWHHGQLRRMRGRTDDNGTAYDAVVERGPGGYTATLNGKPVTLPADAFPASVWHYGISDHTLLFDLKSFGLMRVKIAKTPETLTIDKRKIPTERFDLTGDWQATAWFDARKRLVRFRYVLDGHEVVVRLDD
jgi:hypothetical protein